MKNRAKIAVLAAATAMLVAAVPFFGASADEHEGRRASRVPPPPVVAKECSACHMVYPAGLLPASSWQRMMDGLGDHFGENASLDAATTAEITAYLTANAGKSGRRGESTGSESPLRISEQPWFRGEHDEITPAYLKRRNIKSFSDCKACHRNAEMGQFEDEDDD